ncbi:hypothetical protein AMEX_G16363 [Astyanax mexicanus]|uniref:DUF5580 domain-containing protein n=1 Tax=Astyanax mexicanus TaxID=7994 RepID=A0A8T2LD43_ASTMX|nr:hypothetical protein AMEX_G16363 [Astyanax mexicanus]
MQTKPHITEQIRFLYPEDSLLLALSEELKDLELHSLERIEKDIRTALDTSRRGTIHQSELTYLFLRWKVPLRLPTLASLMKTFSSSTHPEQVLYKELLQFIQKLIQNQELRGGDSEMTVDQTGTSGSTSRSYKDAALANLPADFHKQPPVDSAMSQLIGSLKNLLACHPEGLTLNQTRRFCPQLLNQDVLKDYPSVRHLLQSMPKVVRLEGIGVQTRVLLALP